MLKFLYGVSSAAFQVEGDDGSQGRGKSVWDSFCERKGNILNDENAKVACDHYNRYKEDVDLMKELGVNGYRFSISWSRILPKGVGEINKKGIEFYNKLIDKLINSGITPVVTLYHWDLPQALSNMGGFQNPEFSNWFEEYTKVVVENFGDRVKDFITFNEPINAIHSSYYAGVFAPALRLNEEQTLYCIHNMLLAHAKARKIINKIANSQVGIAMSTFEEYPYSLTEKNIEVAKKRFFSKPLSTESIDTYLDPLYLGDYTSDIKNRFPEFYSSVKKDLSFIKDSRDTLFFNCYSGLAIDENGEVVKAKIGASVSSVGKIVDTQGLYWGCKFLTERYKAPICISESGMACNDGVSLDGKVHDLNRVDFLVRNLQVVEKLLSENIPLIGYFVWSFTDNFEWTLGYSARFGLVYIDYNTLKRIPKDSYYWYKQYLAKKK